MEYELTVDRFDLLDGLFECMASFRCPQTINHPDGPGFFAYSAAVIVWFQDTYALPIADNVANQILRLDWSRIAQDTSD